MKRETARFILHFQKIIFGKWKRADKVKFAHSFRVHFLGVEDFFDGLAGARLALSNMLVGSG